MEAYALVWITKDEAEYLKNRLKDLAEMGVIVAVSSPVYTAMKQKDVQQSREYIKVFTRHNDKLGFDYSVLKRGYVYDYGK